MKKVLIIDPESKTRSAIHVLLASESFKVIATGSSEEAITRLTQEKFQLVILDAQLFENEQFDPLAWLRKETPKTKVILLNQNPSGKSTNILATIPRPFDINTIAMYANVANVMDFTNTHEGIMVEDYIRTRCREEQTKALFVSYKDKSGLILINKGRLHYASQSNLKGEAAYYRILSWKEVSIKEIKINRLPEQNLHNKNVKLQKDLLCNSNAPSAEDDSAENYSTNLGRFSKTGVSHPAQKRRVPVFAMLAVFLTVVGTGSLLWMFTSSGDKSDIQKAGQQVAINDNKSAIEVEKEVANQHSITIAPLKQAEVVTQLEEKMILRLHGSNTVGAELAPALVEAYLQQQLGAEKVTIVPGDKENERYLKATFDDHIKVVEIHAHGSSTGFKDMIAGSCDIAMASRRVKAKEVEALADKGVMTSASNEHILSLDGIAVIVPKSNPLENLSMKKLAGIFSGDITNWAEIGGTDMPITVYARDNNSGTYDTFKSIVLGKNFKLVENAKRFESNPELSSSVATDPGAIGFTSLASIGNAKALAIAESGAEAIFPSFFTVSTEDYPLARRLYLYTESQPADPNIFNFIEFVHSFEGQEVVKKVGLVDMNIKSLYARKADSSRAISPERIEPYIDATEKSQRLSLNFRFNSGTSHLDNRSMRDLDRVVKYLRDKLNQQIFLVGFADNLGEYEHNMNLALKRAKVVYEQLRSRGITAYEVLSCGEELPVASNATKAGRHKNRRVEVWIK